MFLTDAEKAWAAEERKRRSAEWAAVHAGTMTLTEMEAAHVLRIAESGFKLNVALAALILAQQEATEAERRRLTKGRRRYDKGYC